MALSTLPIQRRNKVVYGKAASRSRYGSFVDDDEDTHTNEHKSVARPVTVTKRPKEAAARGQFTLHSKSQDKRNDTFDVPSSDDELHKPTRFSSPPRLKAQKRLADDSGDSGTQMSSWEKKRFTHAEAAEPQKSNSDGERSTDTPDAQLLGELDWFVERDARDRKVDMAAVKRKAVANEILKPNKPNEEPSLLKGLSATEGLAARRRQMETNVTSPRSDGKGSDPTSKRSPTFEDNGVRKRVKVVPTAFRAEPVEPMGRKPSLSRSPIPAKNNDLTMDEFDSAECFAAEGTKARSSKHLPEQVKSTNRRANSATSNAHKMPAKAVSAPQPLIEMIAPNLESLETSTGLPSPPKERRQLIPQIPLTPPPTAAESPQTAVNETKSMTPKQARLWSRLLPKADPVPSPSTLPMRSLNITEGDRSSSTVTHRVLTKSKSDVGQRRPKLVDRLKASALPSDDDLDDQDQTDVMEVDQNIHPAHKATPSPLETEQLVPSAPSSQSHSQSKPPRAGGPKITYSSARSFLPEDSLEEELMLGLITDAPRSTKPSSGQTSRSGAPKKASEFDMDDSDGGGNGRLQTIDELRTSGRNRRTMQDIDGLFGDIANHNFSNRSRRRSALAELASKLTDKSFAKRFVGHSFELQLIAECSAAPDPIADFAFASCLLFLLVGDLPEHSVSAINEGGVLDWLINLLGHDSRIEKVVKDRSSNMAKASQASFIQFVEQVRTSTQIWETQVPASTTPRLLGLKTLERLVRKLRQAGNTSELLDPKSCGKILREDDHLPEQEDGSRSVEMEVSVSLLQLLSTSTVSLQWPSETVSQICDILVRFQNASLQNYDILIPTLKLCINLTNVGVRNCDALATTRVIQTLLKAIRDGFQSLESDDKQGDLATKQLPLDLLVLALGMMINLAEHSDRARERAGQDEPLLAAVVAIFLRGKKRMLDAESVEESILNVPFGYLAVVLADLCQNHSTRNAIAAKMPKQNLITLVEAVEEFVAHNQKVDAISFDGEEGAEVWGAFTEKLKAVLVRLRAVA